MLYSIHSSIRINTGVCNKNKFFITNLTLPSITYQSNLLIYRSHKSTQIERSSCFYFELLLTIRLSRTYINPKNHMATDAVGMKGYRSRNEHGPLREKRGDTHVETVEKQYNVDFGVRGDMHLDTLLEITGYSSLNNLLHKEK